MADEGNPQTNRKPETPWWTPSSEAEIADALRDGIIREDHYREVKREAPEPERLARAIASLAVDGGTLILGLAESGAGNFALHPIPLKGERERIEQICLGGRIDPPLHVRIETVRSASDPDVGYLFVAVPVSPSAPHMVGGKYWGRSDATKYALSDSEVRRIHDQAQALDGEDLSSLLGIEIRRDPWKNPAGSHLFVVAEPFRKPRRSLVDVMDEDDWGPWLYDHALGGEARKDFKFAPAVTRGTTRVFRRAGGWAFSSGLTEDRVLEEGTREQYTIDLEVSEHASLRLYCGRAGERISDSYLTDQPVIFEELILGETRRVVLVAANLAREVGYFGSWGFAVGVTNTKGAVSYWSRMLLTPGRRYSEQAYMNGAVTTFEEMEQDPNAVVRSLLGMFNRALNDDMVPIPH